MIITVSNAIYIKHPSAESLMWCKKNLTIANLDYAMKARMHLWLGDTSKVLTLYEQHGDTLVLPFGTLRTLPDCISKEGFFTSAFADAESVDYGGNDVPLYDYQKTAVDAVYKAQYGILQSPAGSGKTQMGIALAKKFGKRALWLTHTLDLLRQSKARAEQYMDNSLIGTIAEGKVNIGKGITFATIQTMCKLDLPRYKDLWDVIIVDECFPAGTMVQTPHGSIPIQYILPGELVVTRNERTGKLELCEVEEIQERPLKGELVRVNSNDGQNFICTYDHPIFTENGYKKAGELTNDDEVLRLRQGFRYFDLEQNPTIRLKTGRTVSLLFQRLFDKRKGNAFCLDGRETGNSSSDYDTPQQNYCVRKDETKQSYAERKYSSKGVRHAESNGTQTSNTGRERERADRSTETLNECVERIRTSSGIQSTYSTSWKRLPLGLQNRHCATESKSGDRGRRKFSLSPKNKRSRYEKDGVLTKVRVDSVEILEQSGDGTFGELCRNRKVYNLAVAHNHNYFAEGVLVHNCHRCSGTPTALTQFYKVLNNLAARHKIGLSATVHRADGMIGATYALLGEIVHTVPDEAVGDKIMKVGILPVGTGVEISRACLNTDGTLNYTKLIAYLTENPRRQDVIIDMLKHNEGKSCLILSDRLNHLTNIMVRLPSYMLKDSVMVSGEMTSKVQREKAIEDMRTGKKKYLFATYSLAKEGLDIPRLERLFLTTPQKDYAVVTQSIGRIARTFEGKSDPIVYDFVDNIAYLVKSYKKRCATYRKNGCYFVEEV